MSGTSDVFQITRGPGHPGNPEITRGPGHPDPEIIRGGWGGGGGLKKKCFRPFGPQFRLKIKGKAERGDRALSWIRHCLMYS